MSKGKSEAFAVMEFVQTIVGAYSAGFTKTPILTIGQLYQIARNHVKDTYGVEEPPLSEVMGEEFSAKANPKLATTIN